MQRIIIPTHYVQTRSTPMWTKETAPASIWKRHLDAGTRQGVYPRLSVMQGAIRYYGYADETSPNPVETMTIEAGQFGVFPPENGTALRHYLTIPYLMSIFTSTLKF